jgi:hypothetical protein
MRILVVTILVGACATASQPIGQEPATLHERLGRTTRLLLDPEDSTGTITTARRLPSGWDAGMVPLAIGQGELVARADELDVVAIERLAIQFVPVDVPDHVLGPSIQITQIRLDATARIAGTTTWEGLNVVAITAAVSLRLSWAIAVDGSDVVLGSPTLPDARLDVVMATTGAGARASIGLAIPGELWSWAGLFKLDELRLQLAASTP